MPRHSDRKADIALMTNHVNKLRKFAVYREAVDEDNSIEDDYLMVQEYKLKRMKNSQNSIWMIVF
jgi:hypothetical protein